MAPTGTSLTAARCAQDLDSAAEQALAAITREVERAPAPIRTSLLSRLRRLGTKPAWREAGEALTWWVARLLHLSPTCKMQVRGVGAAVLGALCMCACTCDC
jgi:hypothetical protein